MIATSSTTSKTDTNSSSSAAAALNVKAERHWIVPGHASGEAAPSAHTVRLTEAFKVNSNTNLSVVETPPAPSIEPNACEWATVVMAVQTVVPPGSPLETRLKEGNGNLNIDTDKPSFADHQALGFTGRIELAANMQEWTPAAVTSLRMKGAHAVRWTLRGRRWKGGGVCAVRSGASAYQVGQ